MSGRGRAALATIVAAALTAMALALPGGSAAGPEPSTAETQAQALAAAPGLDRRGGVTYGSAAEDRAEAEQAMAYVPLPAQGNVNGVRWEETGGLQAAVVETIVEYNAFCQWLRAARDGPDTVEALAVLDEVPSWPGFRDQPDDELIRRIVAEAHEGAGDELAQTLADCDASHTREVAYAESLGLTPSS